MNSTNKALRLPLRWSRPQTWTRAATTSTLRYRPHVADYYIRSSPSPHGRLQHVPHHASFPATFSTCHAIGMAKAKVDPEPEQDADLGSKPGLTPLAMSFESIGIGANMKRVVIMIASVTAMLELFMWCESIWNWWKGEEGDKVD